mgnify:CR=1 FL=1
MIKPEWWIICSVVLFISISIVLLMAFSRKIATKIDEKRSACFSNKQRDRYTCYLKIFRKIKNWEDNIFGIFILAVNILAILVFLFLSWVLPLSQVYDLKEANNILAKSELSRKDIEFLEEYSKQHNYYPIYEEYTSHIKNIDIDLEWAKYCKRINKRMEEIK